MLGARHQRVQRLRRLVRRANARHHERAFVAEGVKVVAAALDAGVAIESVYLAAEGADVPAVQDLARRAFEGGARVFELGPGLMDRIADTVSPQPICAVVAMAEGALDQLLGGPATGTFGRTLFVCAEVRDPGNLGAVLRSAAAAGVTGVVCGQGCADVYNPKVVRASAGAIFHVPVVSSADVGEALVMAKDQGYLVIGTSARHGESYLRADLSGDVAIVLGNEASGIPADVASRLDLVLTIPMASTMESLNVAMTATVLAFDIARRRTGSSAEPPGSVT